MKAKVKTKRLSALVAVLLCLPLLGGIVLGTSRHMKAQAAESYTVSTYDPMQEFDGWGTSLIWWANNVGKYDWEAGGGETTVREEIMELLYGKDGLEYNIARFNVGGGDNPNHSHVTRPQHMEGYSTLDERFLPTYDNDVDVEVNSWNTDKVTVTETDGDENTTEVEKNKKDAWTMDDVTYAWEEDPDYTNDAAQRWCMEWIYANAKKLGVEDELITEYFSNSPPWYMTKSACASGAVGSDDKDGKRRDNLLAGREDEFAQYFVEVLLHLINDKGYKFQYVDPFNESTSGWWPARSQKQEGCYLTNAQRADVLYYLVLEMDKHDELADIKIAFDDSTGADKAWAAYEALKSSNRWSTVKPRIGKLNYHLYEGSPAKEKLIADEAVKEGWQNWMSEMGYKSDKGATSSTLQTGYLHTDKIRQTLYNGANAYVLWQVIEELSSQINSLDYGYGPIKVSYFSVDDNPELANYGYTLGSYYVSKQYYMLGQYSKYIRPGYRILPTTDTKAVAAISPDGKKVVIVHANNSDTAADLDYTLLGHYITNAQVIVTDENQSWAKSSLAASGNKFSYTVNPYSVTTFVFDVEQYATKPVDPNVTQVSIKKGGSWEKLSSDDGFPAIADINASTYSNNKFYLTNSWSGKNPSSGDGYDGDSQWVQGNSNGSVGAFIKFTNTAEADFVFKCKKNGANDAGALKFELYDGTTKVQEQPNLKATSENGGDYQVIWSVKELDKTKNYAVRIIAIDDQWTNLSRVDLYDNERVVVEYESPQITAATVKGGNLYINVTEATPATEYKVYWRAVGTNAVHNATVEYDSISSTAIATGLTGGSYDIWVSDTAGEKYSQTVTVRNAPVDSKLLYYVNAATANVGNYTIYERAAVNNTYQDQAFGADPVTGKEWGLASASNAKYDSGKAGSIYQAMGDVVSSDGNSEEKIEYKFELENGNTYDIMLGAICPWAGRPEDVSVNGAKVGKFGIDQSENFISITNIQPVEDDGKYYITVTVSIPTGETEGSVLGTIMVAKNGDTANAFATAAPVEDVTPEGAAANVKHYKFGSGLTAEYVGTISISGAYVYGVDGVQKNAQAVTFNPFAITNSSPNAEAARITGVADGLYFDTPLTLTSTKATVYYYVDCGTDGSNAASPGSLQGGVPDKQSSGGSWGYTGGHTAGWQNENALNSVHYDVEDNFYYTFTGLTQGETVDIEVCGNVHDWAARNFDVYFGADKDNLKTNANKIGSVNIPGKSFVKLRVTVTIPASTCYMAFKTTTNGQKPMISYISIATPAEDTPAAPTLNKTEVSKTDTIKVSGITAGDLLVLSTEDGTRIGEAVITTVPMEVDLGAFTIPDGTQAVFFSVRHDGSLAEGLGTMVMLPQMVVSNIRDELARRNVLHLAPSMGVTVQDVVVVAPSGKKTNVMGNEYFNYVVTENGDYTVRLTTKSNKTYVQTVTIDNLDSITFDAEYDRSWTDGDINVVLNVEYCTRYGDGALAEIWINDVKQDVLAQSYTLPTSENKTYSIRAISTFGREVNYEFDVTNIDKSAAAYTVTPDYKYADGFAASLVSNNGISGGTFTVTMGDNTYACTNGLRLVEAGEYSVLYTMGTGKTDGFKVNLAYDTASLKALTVTRTGNTVSVSGKPVHVYQMGTGKEISVSDDGYALDEGYRYLVVAETDEGYEALIVTCDVKVSSAGSAGCRSSVNAASVAFAALALALSGVLVFVRRRKGGMAA